MLLCSTKSRSVLNGLMNDGASVLLSAGNLHQGHLTVQASCRLSALLAHGLV